MSSNSSSFTSAIEEHLELKRRNRHLDSDQPLESFAGSDPFHNNPLFKSEQEARREEEETGEQPALEARPTLRRCRVWSPPASRRAGWRRPASATSAGTSNCAPPGNGDDRQAIVHRIVTHRRRHGGTLR